MTGVQSTLVSPDGRMLAFIVSVDEGNTFFLVVPDGRTVAINGYRLMPSGIRARVSDG
mgnify:CR=1 FL=1|jgi:hypothetical protein